MGDVITGLVKGNESLNRQFINNLSTIDAIRIVSERIPFKYQTEVINTDLIDSSVFILSHEIQSLLVETSDEAGFYLTDVDEGFTRTTERVLNFNNEFVERFIHSDLVDTSLTTGSIVTSSGELILDVGELYYSKLIAKNNYAYTNILINATGDTTNIGVYYSIDGGATYTETAFNTPVSVLNSSVDGIKIKLTNSTSSGLSMPVTMPVTFGAGSSVTLTQLKVNYS